MRLIGLIIATPLVLVSPAPTSLSSAPADSTEVLPFAELRLGDRLIAILRDRKQTAENRIAAAQALGQLRYLPAIPHLLRHIALSDDAGGPIEWISSEDGAGAHGPCVRALRRFGPEVVAPAVKMYLAPTTTAYERECVQNVLCTDSFRCRDVRTHLDAINGQVKDSAQRERFKTLYRLVNPAPPAGLILDLTIPHKWDKP